MDAATAGAVLSAAHQLYTRANETSTNSSSTDERPPVYKVIGICLAIGSGLFIGVSFVLKKLGLLKANEKYQEEAGEGYGYLKNAFWWSGMALMIVGEVLNFVAYAFTDAILVTPLGALSVVITTILSAIFLKERLSMVGQVACFLCIVGSVVIVMNAPEESSVSDIQEMQHYVITPGFLSYAGVIILGSVLVAFFIAPKYGKKNMLVYISICSWIGGLSVVATQGLGAAIIAQIGGKPQFNQWFIYILLFFVIGTLLTEIIYLNKALNLFNAAMVTPTYYVYFTSTTIITSAVLFQGFKGTVTSIVTVVMGFLVICSGVVLLQLSKSAKDVPDAAVFNGDLDQIHTIAEQEQPETEPKADAIRGAAALVRRFSTMREKMEIEEMKRLRMEKEQARLKPLNEDGPPQFEWDGLRRRKTMLGSQRSRVVTTPNSSVLLPPNAGSPHPPLGMSHFPTAQELLEDDRPFSAGLSSLFGTLRSRAPSVLPGHPDFQQPSSTGDPQDTTLDSSSQKPQSPMYPVPLTEITVTPGDRAESPNGATQNVKTEYDVGPQRASSVAPSNNASSGRRLQFRGEPRRTPDNASLAVPSSPNAGQHSSARRQFSFQNLFKWHRAKEGSGNDAADDRPCSSKTPSRPINSRAYGAPHAKTATEEERLGLVKGDSINYQHGARYASTSMLPSYEEEDDLEGSDGEYGGDSPYQHDKMTRYGRGITQSPPTSASHTRQGSEEKGPPGSTDVQAFEEARSRAGSRDNQPLSRPSTHGHSSGTSRAEHGAFI